MASITVHDPRGYPPKVTGKRLAPRLESLDGKVVYLVDCLFDNSETEYFFSKVSTLNFFL